MRTTSQKELESVLRLDAPARFSHFVKRVVDEERAWGLWDKGWALMAADDDSRLFPLWPSREYAELFCNGDWASYQPEEIPLNDLLEDLFPKLSRDRIHPAIFPTSEGKGMTPSIEEVSIALRAEMEKYE